MMIKKEKDTWNREGKIINKLLILFAHKKLFI